MPIYEYLCEKCQNVHEAMQKFSDAPLTECPDPACKGSLQKLMSLSSFALKGSGWYTSDYKRKSAGASGTGAGEKKTESAPAPACKGG